LLGSAGLRDLIIRIGDYSASDPWSAPVGSDIALEMPKASTPQQTISIVDQKAGKEAK
jgi:hypothetical protein